jgi:predicted enzyme related to lactoylglutathione lyase
MLKSAPIRAFIPVSDMARARKFYEKTIGLEPTKVFDEAVLYECGGAEAFMYITPNAGTSKANQAFWQVADVEAEVADLKSRGVKFEVYDLPGAPMKNNIATAGDVKIAWFTDTEGNIMAVSQRLR